MASNGSTKDELMTTDSEIEGSNTAARAKDIKLFTSVIYEFP